MFGEYRMGCRNDAKAHIDPRISCCNDVMAHIAPRIVCCNDVMVIPTSEWDRIRKNYALGYSQSQL